MDPNKSITLGMAFQHCMSTFSYWAWLVGIFVVGVSGILLIHRAMVKANKDMPGVMLAWCVAFFMAFVCAIFMRPEDVAANTSYAFYLKGEFLGY